MEEKRQVSTENTVGGQVVTEKTSTSQDPEEKTAAQERKSVFQGYYLVYYILGAIEIFLAFRLVFKLLGANPNSGFVSFMYAVTGAFVAPFTAIFHTATTSGVETTSVLEPATIIAMIVYAIVGWGLAKLVSILMAGDN